MSQRNSQIKVIKEYLQAGNSITSFEAFTKFKVTRLSSIIYYLKHNEGLPIKSVNKTGTNTYGNFVHYAEYSIDRGEDSES